MAHLTVLTGSRYGSKFQLEGNFLIGREPSSPMYQVFGNDNAVSRRHARIYDEKDALYLVDTKSTNGTLVDGKEIQSRHRLEDGDRIRICGFEFMFCSEESDSDSSSRRERSPSSLTKFLGDDAASSHVSVSVDVTHPPMSDKDTVGRSSDQVKLKSLLDMIRGLGRTLDVADMMENLLDSIFRIFVQAERGFVGVLSPDGELVPAAVQIRGGGDDHVRVSRSIVEMVRESRQAVLFPDVSNSSIYHESESLQSIPIRSVMCVPLLDGQNNFLGILQLDTAVKANEFSQEDLELLAGIAPQCAFALSYANAHRRELEEREISRDLQLARTVQESLLPECVPEIEGYDFHSYYKSAKDVGGDYYDFVRLPGGRWGIVIADVVGKGIAASLWVAKLSSDVKYLLATEAKPSDAMSKVNVDLCRRGGDGLVTMTMMVLDPKSDQLTIVNAGHWAPLLRKTDGEVETLGEDVSGMMLGVEEKEEYEEFSCTLQAGEFVVVYTDGITEAHDMKLPPKPEYLYDDRRLIDQVKIPHATSEELVGGCVADVERFLNGSQAGDDMCLVCFRRVS